MSTKMKSFYRQKKSGIAKPSSKKSRSKPVASEHSASPHLQDDDYDKKEQLLRQFDLNMAYGPCLGMSRLARWERASRLGLNPPKEIEALLKDSDLNVGSNCLWDGLV
ncbi:hypothetical protein UlMin_024873 [Ulmus minor]